MSDCPHDVVKRGVTKEPTWACEACGDEFLMASDLDALEEETNAVIDMAIALFTNVLMNLHRQAGVEPPQELTKEPELRDCESEGHEFVNGACKHCEASQFLGE